MVCNISCLHAAFRNYSTACLSAPLFFLHCVCMCVLLHALAILPILLARYLSYFVFISFLYMASVFGNQILVRIFFFLVFVTCKSNKVISMSEYSNQLQKYGICQYFEMPMVCK